MASEYPDINFTKLYRKPVIFILLALIGLVFVWKVQIKWITISVGVISALIILYNLQVIQILVTAQIRYNRLKDEDENVLAIREEPTSPRHQKIVYFLFLSLFIPLAYGLTFSGKLVENFLYWKPFVRDILIYGSIAGFIASWLYHQKFKAVYEDKEKQDLVTLLSFVIPMLVVFHSIVWYNYLRPSPVISVQKVLVNSKSVNYKTRSKWLFLNINGRETRFEIPDKLHEKVQETDSLNITIMKGALGYSYVSTFEIIRSH